MLEVIWLDLDMKKLIWDFFGPEAGMFAQHHARHLKEFAEKEGIEKAESGTEKIEDHHSIAFLKVPEAHGETVVKTLKPKRVTDV